MTHLAIKDNPFASTPTGEYAARIGIALVSILLFAKIPSRKKAKN